MLKVYDFTEPELEFYRAKCNFTKDERMCFDLKAKNWSIVQIAQEMNVSEPQVSILTRRIKNKIIRVS